MNRSILIQITAPFVLIGLLLFGTCLASVWSINRLQRNLAHILTRNVIRLKTAQELEIKLRQLRFHSLVYVMDPKPERKELIDEDHTGFEAALAQAQSLAKDATNAEEKTIVQAIQEGYQRYRAELGEGVPGVDSSKADYVRWADAHPVHYLQAPCRELLRLNKEAMERTAQESEGVSSRASTAMLLLGLLGPASGLIGGYGIARGLSRSIARLSVRLRDVHAHLDQEVGSVQLAAGGNLADLDRQLDRVVSRVEEVVARMQQQQQEMLRAEQLAAVGQLAASVAHEVRNPLTAIKLLVGAALRPRNSQSLSPDDLRVIHGEIGRLERTVQTLLDFARPPRVERQLCDLREVIDQALGLVRSRANQQRVELAVHLPDQPVPASVDRSQFGTIIVNLFLNALDALAQGGRLQVDLVRRGPDEIRLTVCDNGPGIPPEVVGRLFTPFATTKATGTGLGLSICRRIVQEHGGAITGANRPEGGACFTITLPVHSAEVCHAGAVGR
jgi:signal transduction histidine kinase